MVPFVHSGAPIICCFHQYINNFLTSFLTYLLPYLFTYLFNFFRTGLFQVRGRRKRPNVALVFMFCVIVYFVMDACLFLLC